MNKKTLVLSGFIILKFVIQYFLINPEYDLHRDEYLHLDQANHLAWGYISVPPFTSWVSFIILILGNDVFWVKFFPALFGALTIYLVWKIIRDLNGGMFALVLGATSVLFSSLLRLNMLYQPNSADIFFWTLLYFLLIRYFTTEKVKWLFYAGLAFAFAFLNKYNILFLAAGLVPALLLTRQREIFRKKALYYSAAIALLVVLPNLYWQFQNDFPVIHHMRELAETQLVNVNRGDFLKEQVLFFIGSIHVVIAGIIVLVVYRPFAQFRFIVLSYIFTIALFVFLRAKGYYAIGLYPALIAFGAVYIEYLLRNGWKRQLLRPVVILIPVLLFIPIVKVAFPIYSPQQIANNTERYKDLGLLRWEDGNDHTLPQDFADMLGWKELAEKVDRAYATIPYAGQNTLVLCDNYGQAGAINYYTRFKSLHAVSMNADYINWFPDIPYKNVILIQETDDDDPGRNRERPIFENVESAGRIENIYAREFGASVYVLRNAKIDIKPLIEEEMREEKAGN